MLLWVTDFCRKKQIHVCLHFLRWFLAQLKEFTGVKITLSELHKIKGVNWFFILTPQCAVWLRAMACTLWSLTQWCDAHCGVWPHRGMYIVQVHCTTMDFLKLLTTALDREVWLCGRNPIIQRKFNRIRKYFSLFIRAKMFSKNDKIEVENLVTHSL